MRVRRLAGAVAALGLVVLGGGLAQPASAASEWAETYNYNFSSKGLPEGCQAYQGKYTAGANAWAPSSIKAGGGALTLSLEQKASSGQKYTSGGIGCFDWAQRYGRYEIHATVPAGVGLDSMIALWPESTKGAENGWTGVEIAQETTGVASVTNGYGTGSTGSNTPGTYAGGLHSYVIEWRPDSTRVLVDNREVFSQNASYTGRRWPALSLSTGEASFGLPDKGTKLPAQLVIDSVKVWKYTGKAKAVAAPTAAAAPKANDPSVPGSVVISTAAASGGEAASSSSVDKRTVAFAVAGAMVTAGVAFGALRLIIKR